MSLMRLPSIPKSRRVDPNLKIRVFLWAVFDLDYEFDPELLARDPVHPRSSARMLVYDRKRRELHHSQFLNLPEFLDSGTLLVVNQSKVLMARFLAKKLTGAELEGLFLKVSEDSQSVWVWLKGRLDVGDSIKLLEGPFIQVLEKKEKDTRLGISGEDFQKYLSEFGLVPLPPYIRKSRQNHGESETTSADLDAYQSIWSQASNYGASVAAPTASLHFDEELLTNLERKGIQRVSLDLFVGAGTFEPLTLEKWESKKLHEEKYLISEQTWKLIDEAKRANQKIICVGTTTLRALESHSLLKEPGSHLNQICSTDLFVRSPFNFQIADGLITNFHWPRSSLLALVAAFVGESGKSWKDLYSQALAKQYRLFSYGDGMLIL